MLTPCPSRDLLQHYVLGKDLGQETEAVERHLDACGNCVEELHALHGDARPGARIGQNSSNCPPAVDALHDNDPLVSGLCKSGSSPRFNNPLVEKLRIQLRHVRFVSAAAANTPPVAPSHETPAPPQVPGRERAVNAFLSPPQTAGELGRLGKFRVLKELGRGGMGVVYLAEDTSLTRMVALKVMNPNLAESGCGRERFQREARTAAQLQHVHVVTIFEVGIERGILFLAMPYLQGESLEDRLGRGPLPLSAALRIARETAEGLAAAHERNLIHRDIKPANLFLEGSQASVKILDFGLARPVEGDSQLTQSGVAVGTPAYMAPEQIGGHAEQRSDLFSLGCVLYRLVTGHLPFPGRHPGEIFPNILLGRYRPVSDLAPSVPVPIATLIHNLLAVEMEARPASAAVVVAILKKLEALCATVPEPVSPDVPTVSLTGQTTSLPRARQRRGLILLVAACAASVAAMLFVGVVGMVIALHFAGQPRAHNNAEKDKDAATHDKDKDREPKPEPTDPPKPLPPLDPRPTGKPLPGIVILSRPERVEGVEAWDLLIDQSKACVVRTLVFGADGTISFTEEDSGKRYQFDFTRSTLTNVTKPEPPKNDGFVWSPDGKTRAKFNSLTVDLLDPNSDRVRQTLDGPTDKNNPLVSIHWSPTGRYLVGVEKKDRLWIWEPKTGAANKVEVVVQNIEQNKYLFHWREDEKWLVIQDYIAFLIDVENHKAVSDWKAGPFRVCWAPDGRSVAITSETGRVPDTTYVVPLPEGKLANPVHRPAAPPLAWSPNGSFLAWPNKDDAVDLVDPQSLKPKATLKCWSFALHGAFSRDGKTLAVFTTNKRLQFWDVKTTQMLGTFVLLPEGRWLAISAEGHYRGSENVEDLVKLRYKVKQVELSPENLTAAEFAERFRWKNDPERIRLLAP